MNASVHVCKKVLGVSVPALKHQSLAISPLNIGLHFTSHSCLKYGKKFGFYLARCQKHSSRRCRLLRCLGAYDDMQCLLGECRCCAGSDHCSPRRHLPAASDTNDPTTIMMTTTSLTTSTTMMEKNTKFPIIVMAVRLFVNTAGSEENTNAVRMKSIHTRSTISRAMAAPSAV